MIGNDVRDKRQEARDKGSIIDDRSGFTLIEILVSLAIFTSALVMISGIFVFSTRAQQKTAVIERVQGDARYAMEAMVREIRAGSIDYARYNNAITIVPEEVLYLKSSAGEELTFFKGPCEGDAERDCLKININGASADITGKGARGGCAFLRESFIRSLSSHSAPTGRLSGEF